MNQFTSRTTLLTFSEVPLILYEKQPLTLKKDANTDVPKTAVPGAVLPRVNQAHNFRAGKSIAHFLIQKSVLFVIIKEFPQSRASERFKIFV